MTGWIASLALGLLLGVRHAFDPDHVVAIGTITTRTPSLRRSAGIGALWGLGHTLTILGVGGSVIVLRAAVSPRAALAMEFAVAVMLIALGVINLLHSRADTTAPPSNVRPFIIGMVHGVAGSAAIALLVLATIRETLLAMFYLIVFGAGTIAGMVCVTALMAAPMNMLVVRSGASRRWLTAAAGLVSLAFGLFLMQSLGGPAALLASEAGFVPR